MDSGGDPTAIPELTFEEFQARPVGVVWGRRWAVQVVPTQAAVGKRMEAAAEAFELRSSRRAASRGDAAARWLMSLIPLPALLCLPSPQKFYRDYYHPSNARFWFHGDDPGGCWLCGGRRCAGTASGLVPTQSWAVA